MGTIAASSLIARVATTLFDTNNAKWSQSELLGYLNDGQRVIATNAPSDQQGINTMVLAAGARQVLPVDAWVLIDVVRNMGTDGATPGRAIRIVSRRLLDGFNPNWMMTVKPTLEVQSFIYDLRDQTSFFVYPPNIGGQYIEVNIGLLPPNLTSPSQAIGVLDIMDEPLCNYMLFRACSKMGEYAPDPKVAADYWALFTDTLAIHQKSEQSVNPNNALEPATPPGPPVLGES